MINRIQISDLYTFSNTGSHDGVLLTGNFFNGSSLSFDELSIDTLNFSIRYFGTDNLSDYVYGTPVIYYKDDRLAGKYFLENVVQTGANIWEYSCISAVGLLDNTYHYGGIYTGQFAGDIIDEIISGSIDYSTRQIFDRIKLYGWLPIATKRENLQQVLFACGGCIKKDSNGNPYITILENTTPIQIASNKVTDGRITFDKKATEVSVTEHAFSQLDATEEETIFEGELSGQSFKTPKGNNVTNAALVTFDNPYHSIRVEGTTVLNNEIGVNYVVVSASANAVVYGKPYVHAKNIIYRDNEDVPANNGENVITVTDATLVSLANSSSVGERTLAYHGYANTVEQGIYLSAEMPGETVEFTNPWGKTVRGIIKELDGEMGATENYADAVIMTDYTPPTIQASHTLVSITVTTPPTRIIYEAGESFSTKGMVVTATYDDNETAVIKNYIYTPSGALTANDSIVTISYTELGVTKTTTQAIEVSVVLKRIAITTPPSITVYGAGENFNPAGMIVTAYYSDGTSAAVNTYTYTPSTGLTTNDNIVTISYTEDGITCIAYQAIAVDTSLIPASITVIKNPDKMKYRVGEYFDTIGMICQVIYSDYSINSDVKGYVISPSSALTANDTAITISYTFNGTTISTTLAIDIISLASIAITKQPTKTSYYEDEFFSPIGMEVTATYSDGSTDVVENYSYSPTTALVYGQDSIRVSYTEGGITRTTDLTISVTYYDYDFTKSIVIPANQTITLAGIGATHKNIRVVCIGGGTGGNGGQAGEKGKDSRACSASRGGSSSGSAGTGGSGGSAGTGGSPGKIMYQDLHIDSLSTSLAIAIGAGGASGSGGQSKTTDTGSETPPGAGEVGAATTLTVNGTTISSANGNVSNTGFTDIFTSTIYATPGAAGLAGVRGGDGGESVSFNTGYNGVDGEDAGSNLGGTGGTGSYSTGGQCIYSWSAGSAQYSGSNIAIGATQSGYTQADFDKTTGTWKLSNYQTWTVTKDGRGSPWFYEMTGAHRLYYYTQGSSSVTGATTVPLLKYTQIATANYGIAYGKGWGGGGGGGAAYTANGSTGSSGDGGTGAAGSSKATPSIYGCGGDGGNGGGGGGGGGGTFVGTHENYTYTTTTTARAGGLGGTGGSGATGAQGCVIIYYS